MSYPLLFYMKRDIIRVINEAFEENDLIQSVLQSDKFKEWFSDNGLVDDNGQPLLVYHGSGKRFKKFDIENTYEGYLCFTADKGYALNYTKWDNGDDDWRTIQDANDYLMGEGYVLNDKLPYPQRNDLLNMVDSDGEPIDKEYAYNIVRGFYQEQYGKPTLYYCFLRNADFNDTYDNEYNIFDDDDIWIVKVEPIEYKPIPNYPDDSLNTMCW